MYRFSENSEYGCESNATAYNRLLYSTAYRYHTGARYVYYTVGNEDAGRLRPYIFKNGSVTYGTYMDVRTSQMTTANGYTGYRGNFGSNVSTASPSIINQRNSVFPDGRSVSASWR